MHALYKNSVYCIFAVIFSSRVIFCAKIGDKNSEVTTDICEEEENCLRKCCKTGFVLSKRTRKCEDVQDFAYDVPEWKMHKDWNNISQFVTGFPPNPNNSDIVRYCGSFTGDSFKIQTNGDIYVISRDESYSSDYYCIDNVVDFQNETTEMAMICLEVIQLSTFEKNTRTLQQITQSISLISIVLILILYAFDVEKKSIQTKCIILYCVTLFISTLVIVLMMSSSITKTIDINACIFVGFILQYFGLSFMLWLNLAIFEIFRILSGIMHRTMEELAGTSRRFLMYMLYAFGLPLIITFVTITLQYLPDDAISSNVIRPGLGNGRCWFTESTGAIYAYYYGLEVAILIIDVILIILIAVTVQRIRKPQFGTSDHVEKCSLSSFWQQFYTMVLYVAIWIVNCLGLIYPRMEFWGVINVIVGLQGFFLLLIVMLARNKFLVKNALTRISNLCSTK